MGRWEGRYGMHVLPNQNMSVQELKHISHSGYHIVFFIKRKRPFCVEKIRAEVAETHIKSKAVLKKFLR